MIYDEIHLKDTEVSKMFDVVIDAMHNGKVKYEEVVTPDLALLNMLCIIDSGNRAPSFYVYRLSMKEQVLRMYCYYDPTYGAMHNSCLRRDFKCDGDEIFSFFWDLGNLNEGLGKSYGFVKEPDNTKITDLIIKQDVQRDFFHTFFVVNFFIKNANTEEGNTVVEVSKGKVEKVEKVKKKGSVRYKNVVYVNKVYSFKKVSSMSKSELKRVFKCMCWGVRGHFRKHIVKDPETGKEVVKNVYVRPYLKGKKRKEGRESGNYAGKEYKL